MKINPNCKDARGKECHDYWCDPSAKKQTHNKRYCRSTCGFCQKYIKMTDEEIRAQIQEMATTTTTPTVPAPTTTTTTVATKLFPSFLDLPVMEEPVQDPCQDIPGNLPDSCSSLCPMPGPKKQAYVKKHCRRTCKICNPLSSNSVAIKPTSVLMSTLHQATEPVGCTDTPAKICSKANCQLPGPKKIAYNKLYCKGTCPKYCKKLAAAQRAQEPAPKPTVASSASACVDKTPSQCNPDLCKMPGPKKVAFAKANCKQTCNYCKGISGGAMQAKTAAKVPASSSPALTGSSSANTCSDAKTVYCRIMKPKCGFKIWKKTLSASCQKTCNFCPQNNSAAGAASDQNKPASTCGNEKPKMCMSLGKQKCQFAKYRTTMKTNCQKMCGYCS